MGDYELDHSAQEGVSPDLLPCMPLLYHAMCVIDRIVETNHKVIPPAGPFLHIPTLLLPYPHIARLGLRIRRRLYTNPPHYTRLHIRPLSAPLAPGSNSVLLLGRSVVGTG